ncbi:MAG: anthranilate phosphoribosyltransferase [Deltaproteobacteria bacterium]|nr:anthranilate phosphoribosyltransferase [Deltaproteobacteria bacterium]
MIREAIARLVERENLPGPVMAEVMDEIMGGEATPAQIAAFATALRMKGETVDELAAGAERVRARAAKLGGTRHGLLLDTAGTGGDASGTFNISTAVAFVVAGAGVPVAKHGNRAVSSRAGSADVLEALGVAIDMGPDRARDCLEELGICFLFAPSYHASLKHAAAPRREIGVRTFFNLLGPLANPAGAARQLLGVYSEPLTETIAGVLRRLGAEAAWVVWGEGGLDEISIAGRTRVAELRAGEIRLFDLWPESFGVPAARMEDLRGGDAEANARILRGVLGGEEGPRRDVVLVNAAAALLVAGKAKDLKHGVELARAAIDRGEAQKKLESLVHFAD